MFIVQLVNIYVNRIWLSGYKIKEDYIGIWNYECMYTYIQYHMYMKYGWKLSVGLGLSLK